MYPCGLCEATNGKFELKFDLRDSEKTIPEAVTDPVFGISFLPICESCHNRLLRSLEDWRERSILLRPYRKDVNGDIYHEEY